MARRLVAVGLGLALVACASAGGGAGSANGPGGADNGATSGGSDTDASPVGVVWQLQEIRDPGGATFTPDDPAKYTLELFDDGRAAMRVDCNRAAGGYTLDAGSLGFGPLAMTRAMCPPGSLDTRYAEALSQVVGWSIRDGRLHLDVAAGGGVLVFAKAPPGS